MRVTVITFKTLIQTIHPDIEDAPADHFRVLSRTQWFIAAYTRDVWTRLNSSKAETTGVFGEILKIDSTKKILKKLAGEAKNTATWVTNVRKEYGAILLCVVTSSESNEGLE